MTDDGGSANQATESKLPVEPTDAGPHPIAASRLTRMALLLEGGCVVVAILLSMLGWYDIQQPLKKILQVHWTEVLIWTIVGLATSFALAGTVFLPWKPFRDFRQFVQQFLVPIFKPLSVLQITLISLSAGIGEEFLFRWCIQGGLQTVFPGFWGAVGALLTASVLFGLCHAMGVLYVVLATLIGILLGSIMILSGSVIPSILTHAIYDFLAILMLRRMTSEIGGSASFPSPTPE